MASQLRSGHPVRIVEIILLLCTGLAFLVLVAAVPIELGEERLDERKRRLRPRGRRG
jgi:hypothetical protein